jgi:hypothetical protein
MFSDYVKPFGLMSKPSSSFGSEPNKSEEMVIDKP